MVLHLLLYHKPRNRVEGFWIHLSMISMVPYTYLQERKAALIIINQRLFMTVCSLLLFDLEPV